MVWTWRYEKADGSPAEVSDGAEEFPTQGDAESWLGESWKQLLENGVDQVVLLEDSTKIYGPMPLAAADGDEDEGGDGDGA